MKQGSLFEISSSLASGAIGLAGLMPAIRAGMNRVPATVYGAAGAAYRAVRGKCGKKQLAFEVVGGALVANMVMPVIAEHAPEAWHWTLFFLAGFTGWRW